jgi:uncharacterized membrane protein
MKHFAEAVFVAAGLGLLVSVALGQSKTAHRTYVADIAPIVQAYCLPCHLAESENPSGLHLDTYETLMKGGEKGKPIVPGKPDESIFYLKLKANPPFGKQMPRGKKKMTEEQIRLIREWIEEGASKE